MTKQQTEAHRQRLRALAYRLKGDMSGLRDAALRGSGGEASGGLSNAPLHLADLATDNFEQEVALGLLQNQQQVLNSILVALDRLDAGTYGLCERCGKEIPEERLKAMTYATRCVRCEEQVEETEGEAHAEAHPWLGRGRSLACSRMREQCRRCSRGARPALTSCTVLYRPEARQPSPASLPARSAR